MPNYTRMNCVATAPGPSRAFVLDIDGTLMPKFPGSRVTGPEIALIRERFLERKIKTTAAED